MSKYLTKLISLILSLSLILEQSVFAQAVDLSRYLNNNLVKPAIQSDKFRPLHLRYISYDNQANDFKILLDKGDQAKGLLSPQGTVPDNRLEQETQELMKYFFIGLSLPNEKFWVNLRPDSPDDILDPDLEKTDIGKVFLEADVQLKKDTAGMTSPQTKEGREYWDKLYKKAEELFGSENITIPTITRPWIVPNEIIIREAPDNAYIYKATLKVMLEEDYLGRGRSRTAPTMRTAPTPDQYTFSDPRLKELNQYSTQLIKETIIPKLTYAVNTAKRYAPLRQVYYSLILAQWFKARYANKDTSYTRLINRKDLTNFYSKESWSKSAYFKQYHKSFRDGEYNISQPVYTPSGQTIRSYFSGGISIMSNSPLVEGLKRPIGTVNEAVLPAASSPSLKQYLFPVFYAAGKVDIPTQASEETRIANLLVGKASSPIKIKIDDKVTKWAPNQDVLLPVDESSIPGFKSWIQWNGFRERYHRGYDFAMYLNQNGECVFGLPAGTKIRAVDDGIVYTTAGHNNPGGPYGSFVMIEHGKRDSGMYSVYVHAVPLVEYGQAVKKGDVIAALHMDTVDTQIKRLVHLHFELKDGFFNPQRSIDAVELYPQLNELRTEKQGADIFTIHGLNFTPRIVVVNGPKVGFGADDTGEFIISASAGNQDGASATSSPANKPEAPYLPLNTGGIDFRSLPIVTQAINNLRLNPFRIPLDRLDSINLNQEWLQIQKMVEVGIAPSTERIKEYIQLSCLKDELNDIQKVISCIADILRNEEERCVSTEPELKDILVVIESGRSAQELKAIFTGSRT